tara:strand:- start:50 stop:229 length:180 start_codon:yes stop_codon:yes gene_type:complete
VVVEQIVLYLQQEVLDQVVAEPVEEDQALMEQQEQQTQVVVEVEVEIQEAIKVVQVAQE